MRTEEAEALRQEVMGQVARLLRRYVMPAFAVLMLGLAGAVFLIEHEGRVSDWRVCLSGVDGRSDTREIFAAVTKAFRNAGAQDSADFIDNVVRTVRPLEDKSVACPKPGWWDT